MVSLPADGKFLNDVFVAIVVPVRSDDDGVDFISGVVNELSDFVSVCSSALWTVEFTNIPLFVGDDNDCLLISCFEEVSTV